MSEKLSTVKEESSTTAAPAATTATAATGKKTRKNVKASTNGPPESTAAAVTKKPLTALQREALNKKKATFKAKADKFGPILYGEAYEKDPEIFTHSDLAEILNRATTNEVAPLTALASIKAERNAASPKVPKKKYTSAERKTRYETAKMFKRYKIVPSTKRVNYYLTKKNTNYKNRNFNKNEAARAALNESLEKIALPELKGRRLAKAQMKAELEEYKEVAKEDLAKLRTKVQIDKGTNPNPAFVTHLAMLRKAKYTISATDFKELSILVKQGKDISAEPRFEALVEQSEDMPACDRCLLTTIFGIEIA